MEQFVPWLRQEIRSGRITRVAPTTDLIAYYTALLRDEFSAPVQRTIAPLPEIEDSLFKTRFAARCTATGQPTPAIITPDDPKLVDALASELQYPLILKPKSHLVVGWMERGRLIHNAAELKKYFAPYPVLPGHELLAQRLPSLRWPLLQEYLPAARQRVYSVSGIKDADYGIVAVSLSYKGEQWPLDVGTSTTQVSLCNDAVLDAGVAAVDRLISRGLFELELVYSGDTLFAIDLNPRAFGFIALDVALGRDLPWLWLQSTLHAIKPQPPSDALVGMLEARHHFIHFIRSLVDWRRMRPQARRQANEDPARRAISMVGHADDPMPMLISNLSLLRHPRSLLMTQLHAARQARRRARSEPRN
jgi:predicted ATP-grasp superfamily ATP-dependent carboligase